MASRIFVDPGDPAKPFESYSQFSDTLFSCVDYRLYCYIGRLMELFANGNGGFKNIMYPDIEIAHSLCASQLASRTESMDTAVDDKSSPILDEEIFDDAMLDDDMLDLFTSFSRDEVNDIHNVEDTSEQVVELTIEQQLDIIKQRAALTDIAVMPMPLYQLATKLEFSHFTLFAFACAVLSSTQTSYASVFQVINQNGNLSAPSIESAARVFFAEHFSISSAYSQMSITLEQLQPVLSMNVNSNMPFSTILSPDKRMIDYLFGSNPLRVDQNYSRFFARLDTENEPEPFIANQQVLDAINISYQNGGKIFALFGDEGAGRKFTITHFCRQNNMGCVTIDCAKLFVYDFSFVERAIWSVCREAILTGACCCMDGLAYREDEKTKFFGYMDLALGKMTTHKIIVFTVSREKMPLKEMTPLDTTNLEIPTPNNQEREEVWAHYAKGYPLADEISLEEMAAKFLFTPGKIKSALHMSRSLAAMAKEILIPRKLLFEACYNQMSHELTQKATKIKASFTWDDIVMSPDQRQSLEYACDQMRYRKQVYEQWDYNRKYAYGRGLSVLLFGAPGTGKSMCAQVLANALNLELYRVDLSKVVDKYVGETEKSISMIFREAKKCNVVLFFDECDTLFAKRGDDGGSGQSSNNNKTALLLQEVEAYDGVSVLATNYKHNIDPAFFRRMKFIVEFQFPDPETRLILWKATIPKNTPLAEDVDLNFLAERFSFVGGNIKNCILNAAFLAAGDPEAEGQVHMKHYLQAIRYEFVKTGKVFTRSDFEPYAHLIL